LIAVAVFAALFLAAAVGLDLAAIGFGFIPAEFVGGGWSNDPLRSWLSPLMSAFIPRDVLSVVFDLVFLLIAGRFVEKAIRPAGLAIVLIAGIYLGAALRLILTPASAIPSAGLDPAMFAVIGAYFMLYGLPAALPVGRGQTRQVQIAMLAGIWFGIQAVFALVAQNFEMSITFVEPLGGLLAGVLLARPLLRWQFRRA
jgi:membrane associated rhomboid family serine protease